MKIKKISIENFKSVYGKYEIDFTKFTGLVKFSGPVGAGKSTISEAIRIGLYGNTKDNNNPNYIAWNTDAWLIEMDLESKGREIHIRRHFREPLQVQVDGRDLTSSNKKNLQSILEEFYDVPRIGIEKMCVITFGQFNSIASMNPGDTRNFLDDVFGFKTFTKYNDVSIEERKVQIKERDRLTAIYRDTQKQIQYLQEKKAKQSEELKNSIDVTGFKEEEERLIEEGKALKSRKESLSKELDLVIVDAQRRLGEVVFKGKQERSWYDKYKTGICPTCGQNIEKSKIDECLKRIDSYTEQYKAINKECQEAIEKKKSIIDPIDSKMNELRERALKIRSDLNKYENHLKLIKDNYDDLISDYTQKLVRLNEDVIAISNEIGEWNEMNDLFSKSLRYKLLDTLIPHINNSIQYYITKLEQPYSVKFDQEFKCHIYTDSSDKQISYKDLSTGQKKTLDICIIFGIIQNIIANVDFNVFFLDELFSNMDADTRSVMLNMLQENMMKEDRVIFVVNHAEMPDDFFTHKIRVKLVNKKIIQAKRRKSDEDKIVMVHASSYETIF